MHRVYHCIMWVAVIAVLIFAGCSDSESPTDVSPLTGDTTPPVAVSDAVLMLSDGTGEAVLEWTAPHDDSQGERVARYEIHFSYTQEFDPLNFWDVSTPVPDPPDPGEPGNQERYSFETPRMARDLHVGIRSFDEAGNRSPSSNLATVHVPGYTFSGRCEDIFSRAPLEGLEATISTGSASHYITDTGGGFSHEKELDGGVTYVELRPGAGNDPIHHLDQWFTLDSDSAHTFSMIPVETVEAAWAPNLLQLFKQIVNIFPSGSQSSDASRSGPIVVTKWHERPVPCYIPAFVNDDGVDYGMQARSAAERWMDRTGEPLFTFVDSAPDTGITLVYKSRGEMSGIGVTKHTRGEDGHPIRDEVWLVDYVEDPFLLYKIFLHEFGHTISLGHVSDPNFIMYVGQPLPDDISDDEVRVVQLHEALPVRIDMSIYDENSP